MSEITIEKFSHSFCVSQMSIRAKQVADKFASRNVQYGLERKHNKWFRVPVKVFAARTKDQSEYRFHINQFPEFLESLKIALIHETQINIKTYGFKPIEKNILPIKQGWEVREDQIPIVNYVVEKEEPRSKMVEIQTGKGKSVIGLFALSILRARPVFIIRPMYIEKWIIDLKKQYDIEPEDILVIQGSEHLMAFLDKTGDKKELQYKVALVSNKTFQNYLKQYEEFKDTILDAGYACTPIEFFQHVGSDFRVIDEVHQDFHLNFKIDLYSHVQRSLSLSATMISDNDFITKMYEIAYPSKDRYRGEAPDKYIATRCVFYRFANPKRIRYQDWGSKRYSHNVFETSLSKYADSTLRYMEMVDTIIRSVYLNPEKRVGDKCVIFVASIAFATKLTDWLKTRHKNLDIRRYVEEDPYEDLMEPDIRITTLLSAGTAVDIPQLTTAIMTTALSSSQSNVQGIGRLRKLADGRTPVFIWFTCRDIETHVKYHERKLELLQDKVKSYRGDDIGFLI